MHQQVTKAAAALLIAPSLLFALTACGNETPDQPQSEILTMELPDDVTAKGVVLASVLLGSSDIELAIAEGLVTPAEVEYAEKAVKDGTLQDWVTRAESEIN